MNVLIETAKKNGGFTSDYQLAQAIGVSPQLMSNWQNGRSKPDGLNTLKILKAGHLETEKAIEIIEGGFVELSLIFVTAISSIALLSTGLTRQLCILC